MKDQSKSKLHEVVDVVNLIPDFETKKATALSMIEASTVGKGDKAKMLMVLRYQIHNSNKLTQYLYNALLKFEGLGINKY